MQKWLLRFFLAAVFLIPLQRKFVKPLRSFTDWLIDPSWQLPGIFERTLGFYATDFPILILCGVLIYMGRVRWIDLFLKESNKYLTALLFVAIVSILGSAHPSYGLHYLRLVHFFFPIVICYVLSLRLIEEENLVQKVFQVVLCVALFECAVGIVQYFRQDSLGLKLLGEQSLTSRHVASVSFAMADGSLWIFDWLFHIHREANHVIRAYGTLPHPNVFGGFLVFSLLGTCFLFQRRKTFLLSLAVIVQMFTLFITYSRAALYAYTIGLFVFFLLSYLRREKIWQLASTVVIGATLCITVLYPQLFERGGVVSYNQTTQSADAGRIIYQNVAMLMIKEHPLFGVGFDNYLIAVSDYASKSEFLIIPFFVHNIYMFLCAELGLIGLALFLWFIFGVLKQGWLNRGDPETSVCIAIFAGFLFIGFCDFYLLWHQSGRLMFFLVAGLVYFRKRSDAEELLVVPAN